jgi:hypothetical protein
MTAEMDAGVVRGSSALHHGGMAQTAASVAGFIDTRAAVETTPTTMKHWSDYVARQGGAG